MKIDPARAPERDGRSQRPDPLRNSDHDALTAPVPADSHNPEAGASPGALTGWVAESGCRAVPIASGAADLSAPLSVLVRLTDMPRAVRAIHLAWAASAPSFLAQIYLPLIAVLISTPRRSVRGGGLRSSQRCQARDPLSAEAGRPCRAARGSGSDLGGRHWPDGGGACVSRPMPEIRCSSILINAVVDRQQCVGRRN